MTIVLSGLLFIAGKYYSDNIEQAIIGEINKHVKVEISVGDVEFSFLEKFPYASIKLTDFQTREKLTTNPDNLLKARQVYLLFNIYNIIRRNFKIEKLLIKNAFLNIVVNPDGSTNFEGFQSGGSSLPLVTEFDLQKFIFQNVQVSYFNYPADQEYLFRIDNGQVKGIFSEKKFHLQVNGDFYSNHIRSGNTLFFDEMPVKIDMVLDADLSNQLYTIQQSKLSISGVKCDFSGTINSNQGNKNIDLVLNAERTPLKTVFTIIPVKYLVPVKDYILDGDISAVAKINGKFSGNDLPFVLIDFNISNGQLSYTNSGITLKNTSFKGQFENGKSKSAESFKLTISEFRSEIPEGTLQGKLSVVNFLQPEIAVNIKGDFDLKAIKGFYDLPNVEKLSGNMQVNLLFRNKLKGFRMFSVEDFISSRTSGNLEIGNMDVKLKNTTIFYKALNGSFTFNNADLNVLKLIGFMNESDFEMTGYFRNILPYFFREGEKIYITADFKSDHFDLDDIIKSGNDPGKESYRLYFSDRLNFDLRTDIQDFKFRRFQAHNLNGRIKLTNRKLIVDATSLQTMNGIALLNGEIDGTRDEIFKITSEADFDHVDIQQLFYQMGNFGQDNITDKNLRGSLAAKVYFKSLISDRLVIDSKSVDSYGEIVISDGELLEYTPIYKLSKYIRQEELQHIRFSTLKNSIRIIDEVVYIPQMDIESSSINLKIKGSHTFQNQIDYQVSILLSEILSKKRKHEEDIDGIIVEDDGLGRTTLFLKMNGDAYDPSIKYDTREVRNKIASEIKQEKINLKEVFQKEFDWLHKKEKETRDTILVEPDARKGFIIGWEDSTSDSINMNKSKQEPKDKTGKNIQPKPQKDFIIKWDETNDTIQ
ncbi:MAG: hypothetical protein JW731_02070 [Bacteroidales bacterium]|nr:hypothetical protein [Bacteroidales bacterium]